MGNQKKKKNGEAQRYSWEIRRRRRMVSPRDIAGEGRRRRMVKPRDIAGGGRRRRRMVKLGKAEEEEEC